LCRRRSLCAGAARDGSAESCCYRRRWAAARLARCCLVLSAARPGHSRRELVLFSHASQDPHPLPGHGVLMCAGSCTVAQGWRLAGGGACAINTRCRGPWRRFCLLSMIVLRGLFSSWSLVSVNYLSRVTARIRSSPCTSMARPLCAGDDVAATPVSIPSTPVAVAHGSQRRPGVLPPGYQGHGCLAVSCVVFSG
jgi:hypothetical protein